MGSFCSMMCGWARWKTRLSSSAAPMPVGVSTAIALLLLASALFEACALLFERGRGAELDGPGQRLLREERGLLLADRGAADGAALGPGALEGLEALDADVAQAHALLVLLAEHDHD